MCETGTGFSNGGVALVAEEALVEDGLAGSLTASHFQKDGNVDEYHSDRAFKLRLPACQTAPSQQRQVMPRKLIRVAQVQHQSAKAARALTISVSRLLLS